ncbi:MAG: peptidylprolyl isomerase [bacterium]
MKYNPTKNGGDHGLLAVIAHRAIREENFIVRYKTLRTRTDIPDNAQSRRGIFNTMLEEELLIVEAEARGYDNDAYGRFQIERIQTQVLLEAYHQRFISGGMPVSEDELRQVFIRFNTKIKARHLYAPSFRQADSLYTALQNGKSFEELARENFQDPQLRDTGGSVGYFSVDEMDPSFEDAALTLSLGEISKPVRTAQGYSIIQVQDRMTRPLLTESEYAKRRFGLARYWRSRKVKEATRAYVDSLRRELEISFYKPVVIELLDSIKKRSFAPAGTEDSYALQHDEDLGQKELVRSKLGVWRVKTFNQYAQFTSEEQLQWMRNEENLEDFIAGLVVRAHMLSRAKKLGLHRSESYHASVKQKTDEYLLKRMEETISLQTFIPEDTLENFYQRNRAQFLIPPKIHLREIILNDAASARAIKHQLVNHASFEELAKAHSVRRRSAERNGDLGSFSYQELGAYAERIFPLQTGDWVGPVKIETQFGFFKCVGKDSARARTFNEARSEATNTLKPIWQSRTRQDLLSRIRQEVKVVAYPERLSAIRMN